MKNKTLWKQVGAAAIAAAMVMSTVPATPVQAAGGKTLAVSSQKQLNQALKTVKGKNAVITVKAGKNVKITIPKGTYKVTIRVVGKKAAVVNNGTVKEIVVNSKGTVAIKNNGTIKKVTVQNAKSVSFSGNHKKAVPVVVNAEDVSMILAAPAKITAKKDVNIVLKKGAEKSSITCTKNVQAQVDNQTKKAISVKIADGTTLKVESGESCTITPKGKKEDTSGEDKTDEKDKTDGKDQKTDDTSDGNASSGSSSSGNSSGGTTVETPSKLTEADLLKQGYQLKWQDNFDGNFLNRADWNVELHEKGWVNSEWQEYVDSDKNIQVKDGKLLIKPVETVNADGTRSYTSGRINTQGKHDFKYGYFECRAKVPTGKGYLPAFWMMPTDENLYGQWPKCGEIDIMEVMGQETNKAYGTIHYGEPHDQSQGTCTVDAKNNFADQYHTYACDWEPGKITWYIDGVKFHEESDWFSAKSGQGEVAYPAPFDQPFYVILNLAVGGNWPGNPDADADYINSESLYVDYVRVYQKESYDENVTKPEREVIIRDPDENGNYVINGDFSETEDLGDAENWIFMAQNGGEGTAVIENNTININTIDAGTVDYSIQLVQPDIPVEKGATYKLSFDAWADEARTGIIDVSAPTRSWGRYLKDTKFDMTTEKQTFEYEYTMTDSSDDKGRIEFNFGNQGSVAGVHIANVKLVKTNQTEIVDKKTILADGNLVYNGEFQEGTGRLGYWTVSNNCGAEYKVTGLSDGRRFSYKSLDESIDGNFVLSQDELAYAPNTKYVLKFDAETATEGKNIIITTGDSKFAVTLDKGIKNYVYKFETGEEVTDSSISIDFGNSGEVLLDNVKIMQDSLLLNGNFSADFAGYDVYIDSSADAESVVDSQKEDNAADFTIKNSGDQNWKIQLKQNNIKLEKGQWYKLSFDIKSSVSRTVQYAIQRDGSTHKDSTGAEDWTPYVQETVKLDAYDQADQKYMTVSNTFQMACDTDEESIFNIALGAGGENGSAITDQHRICIDNIILEKTSAPEIDVPVGKNLLTNPEFEMDEDGSLAGWENAVTAPGDATIETGDGKITYSVANVGEADWNIQLKQMGLSLEQGESYTLKCTLFSDVDRVVKVAVMTPSAGYAWHGGEDVVLTAGEAKDITLTITPKEEVFTDGITVDTGAGLFFSMGYVEGYTLGAHTVSISNVSFVKN